jgi:hypothetical protein
VDGFDVKVNRIEDRDEPHVHVYKGGVEYRVSLISGRIMTYGGHGTSTKAQRKAARPNDSLLLGSNSAGRSGTDGTEAKCKSKAATRIHGRGDERGCGTWPS